jgi:hypothetical protein
MENDSVRRREQESFTVDNFRADDAEGIVCLFRAVYGEGYPIRLFYDPAAIIAANRDGRYYSIVARTASGKIVGVTHLYRSAPCDSLYEWGAGLILKEYRSLGVHNRLADFLHNEFVPGKPSIEELFGEAVCNHLHMQHGIKSFRYVETAIEVALMPAEAYNKEQSAPGRVATLNGFRCYKPRRHQVFLPAAYENELHRIYDRLDDTRSLAVADGELPRDRATRAELAVFDFARVSRIAVHEVGHDFRARLYDLERQALAKNVVVLQVCLSLTQPWAGEAADILREQGYFFGGLLPRWLDGDGLLLQKLFCPPAFDDIVLLSDVAKELLEVIKADRQRSLTNARHRE